MGQCLQVTCYECILVSALLCSAGTVGCAHNPDAMQSASRLRYDDERRVEIRCTEHSHSERHNHLHLTLRCDRSEEGIDLLDISLRNSSESRVYYWVPSALQVKRSIVLEAIDQQREKLVYDCKVNWQHSPLRMLDPGEVVEAKHGIKSAVRCLMIDSGTTIRLRARYINWDAGQAPPDLRTPPDNIVSNWVTIRVDQ